MPTAEQIFDVWAQNGKAEGMERGHYPRAIQALERIPLVAGEHALDLGCGNGWATRWLHSRTGRATGIDVAVNMVERAQAEARPEGLTFQRAAFTALPFPPGSIDHAWSMESLYYADDLPAALRNVLAALRPDGTLTVCTDFYLENPDSHSWPTDLDVHMVLLGREGWVEVLTEAGFEVEESFFCPDPDDPSSAPSLAVRARRPAER